MAVHDGLKYAPGVPVRWHNRDHIVLDLANLGQAVVRDAATGETNLAPIGELVPAAVEQTFVRQDLMLVEDEDWREAWTRYEMILPLLEAGSSRSAEAVRAVAEAAGRNPATIYRWIQRY
ncbi:hypothetical protein [Ralstonia psammae]|uniref:hypothetical protein n=1 Tax=Ralstonia psammae TaxID=3058598 RepID=UPI00292FA10B|nr:hypothetical protein [Ralstonia sp. LMG 19083]